VDPEEFCIFKSTETVNTKQSSVLYRNLIWTENYCLLP